MSSDTKAGVSAMKKETETQVAHELRDRPVPPVKGAVTDQTDVRPDPEGRVGPRQSADLADTIVFDGWL